MMRLDPVVRFWEGEQFNLHDGLTLMHCGGHEGATVLHWPAGSGGLGALLTGDVLQVVKDQERVSFLSSSSGLVPRSARALERIVRAIESLDYERLYDAAPDHLIAHNARDVVVNHDRIATHLIRCAVDTRVVRRSRLRRVSSA